MDALRTYFSKERGRITKLANELGVSTAAVSQWHRVPAERVLEVERITGISRHELRPDVFAEASAA